MTKLIACGFGLFSMLFVALGVETSKRVITSQGIDFVGLMMTLIAAFASVMAACAAVMVWRQE